MVGFDNTQQADFYDDLKPKNHLNFEVNLNPTQYGGFYKKSNKTTYGGGYGTGVRYL
jgi:hypothetical protein